MSDDKCTLATIKQRGNFIEITKDGASPLPRLMLNCLETYMTYNKLISVYNTSRFYGGAGEGKAIKYVKERMYVEKPNGALVCMRGFLPQVFSMLQQKGFTIDFIDYNPKIEERTRPNCYYEDWDGLITKFDFRYKQDICLAAISAHDYGIVEAVPAFGKTWIIAMLCSLYPNAKIDIVVTRVDIAATLYKLLLRNHSSVGRVGGGHRRQERITIYVINSLDYSKYDADIVLADEVHEMCTDDKMAKLARYDNSRMYGFTASKETRMDNAWRRLEAIFGKTIFNITQQEAEQYGVTSSVLVQWLDITTADKPVSSKASLVTLNRRGLWRNDTRNKKIAEMARNCCNEGLQVLVLVDTVDHALHLHKYLPEFELCYAEGNLTSDEDRAYYVKHGLLDSDDTPMTAAKRELLRQKFEAGEIRGAIATSVWSVGVSFVSLGVLIRADGKASETANVQAPGRVCRIDPASGKYVGLLIDCMDHFDSRLLRRSYTRRRAYQRVGWTQLMDDGKQWKPR